MARFGEISAKRLLERDMMCTVVRAYGRWGDLSADSNNSHELYE